MFIPKTDIAFCAKQTCVLSRWRYNEYEPTAFHVELKRWRKKFTKANSTQNNLQNSLKYRSDNSVIVSIGPKCEFARTKINMFDWFSRPIRSFELCTRANLFLFHFALSYKAVVYIVFFVLILTEISHLGDYDLCIFRTTVFRARTLPKKKNNTNIYIYIYTIADNLSAEKWNEICIRIYKHIFICFLERIVFRVKMCVQRAD